MNRYQILYYWRKICNAMFRRCADCPSLKELRDDRNSWMEQHERRCADVLRLSDELKCLQMMFAIIIKYHFGGRVEISNIQLMKLPAGVVIKRTNTFSGAVIEVKEP